MSKYAVSSTGVWLFEGGHKFDQKMTIAIGYMFIKDNIKLIIDIGCGDGAYTDYLRNCGFNVIGYDGNPKTETITNGLCAIADFSHPQKLGQFEAVLSLEVGEHIPAEYEGIFLDNLTRHAEQMIVMSWAIPGQGGHGHVNERDNAWVVDEMDERGWNYDREASEQLRASASNCYWFRDTIMVFKP